MENQVSALLKKVGEDMESVMLTTNEFFDFDEKEASAFLGESPVKTTVLKKDPDTEYLMFSAEEGFPNFTRTNGEQIYGNALIVKKKYVNTEYMQYMVVNLDEGDVQEIIQLLSIQPDLKK